MMELPHLAIEPIAIEFNTLTQPDHRVYRVQGLSSEVVDNFIIL